MSFTQCHRAVRVRCIYDDAFTSHNRAQVGRRLSVGSRDHLMWLGSEARVVACPLPERDNVNTMAAMKRVEGAIIYILLKWLCIMVIFVLIWKTTNGEHSQIVKKDPTVVIALLIRNKAHTLPYFLTLLERLDYAKDRISLW